MEAVEHQALDQRRADKRMMLDLGLRSIDSQMGSIKQTWDEIQMDVKAEVCLVISFLY